MAAGSPDVQPGRRISRRADLCRQSLGNLVQQQDLGTEFIHTIGDPGIVTWLVGLHGGATLGTGPVLADHDLRLADALCGLDTAAIVAAVGGSRATTDLAACTGSGAAAGEPDPRPVHAGLAA